MSSDYYKEIIKERPSLSQALSDREISDLLVGTYAKLPKPDQKAIAHALAGILSIQGMGIKTALRLLFVTHFGPELDRLDRAVLHGPSIPYHKAAV